MRGEGRFDGVFGLWYGKGPGVDRSGDALKHANLAGTSPWGGVLALMGDDHTCESSTTAHQSEFAFVDAMIPVLNPAGVQEILDYGLFGYALSRYAGTWVGLKCVKDTVESTATVDGSLDRVATVVPGGFRMPPGGLDIRTHDNPLAQEERLHEYKIPAVLAFLRANPPDRLVLAGGRQPRIGIVTAGKSYLDVLQALDDLGIDEVRAANLGLRLAQDRLHLAARAAGRSATSPSDLETIVVVEEKRGLIEGQIKEILYGTANQPVVIGKKDEAGAWLFPSKGALDTNQIAIAIGERLARRAAGRAARPPRSRRSARRRRCSPATHDVAERTPYFCAGCPLQHRHRRCPRARAPMPASAATTWSQRVPTGTPRATPRWAAKGANWIGEAPFSTRGHIFQNIGDGTYVHSGSWWCARRSPPASTSPSRSCSTTRWR